MKSIFRKSLFWACVVIVAFFTSSTIFILIAGFVWSVDKVSVFLNKICTNWDLNISSGLLGMLPYSIVGSCIIVFIVILIYFLFFRTKFPEEE
jgi:ABC-type phosphate transport system permease subunit